MKCGSLRQRYSKTYRGVLTRAYKSDEDAPRLYYKCADSYVVKHREALSSRLYSIVARVSIQSARAGSCQHSSIRMRHHDQ